MKLFVVATLIAVTSAARLDHLQRSYLPPDNNNIQGNYGSNGFGSNVGTQNGFGKSNGVGSNGQGTNGFGSNGIGANGHGSSGGSNGFGGAQGSNGFGNNEVAVGRNGAFSGSTSNQYLPPYYGSSGSETNGFNVGGSSIKPACSSCGSSRYPSQQYNQGSQVTVPGASYGVPQFGSSAGVPTGAFGSAVGPSDSSFGSQSGTPGSGSFGSQGAVNRQYLAPISTSQNIPQQPFDEKTGYIY